MRCRLTPPRCHPTATSLPPRHHLAAISPSPRCHLAITSLPSRHHLASPFTLSWRIALARGSISSGLPCSMTPLLHLSMTPLPHLQEILLVGGTARSAGVSDAVGSFFGKTPLRTSRPEESVALGAAIRARQLQVRLSSGSCRSGSCGCLTQKPCPKRARGLEVWRALSHETSCAHVGVPIWKLNLSTGARRKPIDEENE